MVTSMRNGGNGGERVVSQRHIRDFHFVLNILYLNLADGYTSIHICILNLLNVFIVNQTKQLQLEQFLKKL